MRRRSFLKKGLVGSAAAAAAAPLAAPAIAQARKELKFVTSWPKNLPGPGVACERIAERINTLSGGSLRVRVFAAGELVPPLGVFDAVSKGTADFYHSAPAFFQGKSPALNFYFNIPFGMQANELRGWMLYGEGQTLYDEVGAQFNLKPFMGADFGAGMAGWFKKEINTVDDIKGLKFRMPGLGGEMLRRLGVAVVTLPAGEILTALQSGAIDGTEWIGPFSDMALGLYKHAKFYYYPGWHEPAPTAEVTFNMDTWKGLTKEQQELFRVVLEAEIDRTLAESNAQNAQALQTLVAQHGVQLKRLPDDVLNALARVSTEVLAESVSKDALSKKVHDSFLAFRKQALGWAEIGDLAFLQYRRGAYS
ncbi:MAG: TRAP transporter substrate-binding protein [Alphaproteobacteria bacterium]|nr:TRAP transporter substrate-binding protein [Alphaproteobacteria bacterium]